MIERYTRPEMGRIWSEQNKFRQWLEVELAAAEALAETGVVPPEAARLLREHAACDPARVDEIEREVKHDVIAFTTAAAGRYRRPELRKGADEVNRTEGDGYPPAGRVRAAKPGPRLRLPAGGSTDSLHQSVGRLSYAAGGAEGLLDEILEGAAK